MKITKYGLDFGTTNSAIAIADGDKGRVLELDDMADDARVVRTLLYFLRRELHYRKSVARAQIGQQVFKQGDIYYTGEQKVLLGEAAVQQYLAENDNRSAGVTRTIYTGRVIESGGIKIPEYFEEVDYGIGRLMQALKTALKTKFYKGSTVFGEFYSLEELIAFYIRELKSKADHLTGEAIDEVVCGRPVHFLDDPEKDAAAEARLKKALELAGFKKIKFVFEPIAAAMQFVAESGKEEQLVLVFDFGGGTLDTAVVRAGQNPEVLASDGVYIGGDLLNADIMKHKLWWYFGFGARYGDQGMSMPEHIYESLQSWYSIPNLNNPQVMNLLDKVRYKNSNPAALERLVYLIRMNVGFGLYEAIEKAKKELSTKQNAVIRFHEGPIQIDQPITRAEFEQMIMPRVREIGEVVIRTLQTAGVGAEDIDVVVRTGGSSLIPIFERLLVEMFGKPKLQQFQTFTSIAAGLAI